MNSIIINDNDLAPGNLARWFVHVVYDDNGRVIDVQRVHALSDSILLGAVVRYLSHERNRQVLDANVINSTEGAT